MYEITRDYLPVGTKRRSGAKNLGIKFIVAHDTGNKDSSAQGNVNYYRASSDTMSASAHTFIDDKHIIECIPLNEKAWHVIYNKPTDNQLFGDDANDIALGVELCYFTEKARTLEAYKRYVWYLAQLCRTYKLDPKKHITGHHILDPERKTDPVNALKTIGKTFGELLHDVSLLFLAMTVVATASKKEEDKPMTVPKVDQDQNASADKSFVEAQKWVKANKVSDGTFPHRAVTRQEVWAMLHNMSKVGK